MPDVCDVPVISGVCDKAGDAAASLVTAPFDWLAQAMGGAAAWMFESVWAVFDTTTMVDLTSPQYTRIYSILFGVAVFVMIGFFMLQVIGGMIRREPAALSRAAFGMAKSILGSFVVLTLLTSALEITDQLSIGIVHAAGTNMEQMGERIALLAAGLAHDQPRRARRRRDHHDLPGRTRDRRRGHRVDQPARPEGLVADRRSCSRRSPCPARPGTRPAAGSGSGRHS